MNEAQVYPSIQELVPSELRRELPDALYNEIAFRYATLGEKYMTDKQFSDGRFINGMMFTNRIENCIEEVVDAVFCILGWILKHQLKEKPMNSVQFECLAHAVNLYNLLLKEKNNDTIA